MNLWATAAQAAVYSIVSISVGMYYKRAIKRDREKLDRLVSGVEAVFGITTTIPEKGTTIMNTIDLKQFRKAVAAGFGVLLIGLLTWASSDGVLASILEPIIPDAFKPLVGVLVGGIATVVAVIRTTNAPAVTAAPTESPVVVRTSVPVSTAQTSIVPLLDAPVPSYL